MNRFSSKEIATSREIRVDRNKANYLRTKGIINRNAMCTTDSVVNIGEIPFGIANKINKYCNMEVYAESKWNLVQCMDSNELRRVFLAPKKIEQIEINDETNNNIDDGNNVGDGNDISDVSADIINNDNTGDMESSESDSEDYNKQDDEEESESSDTTGELVDEIDENELSEDEDIDDNEEEVITRSSSVSEDEDEIQNDETAVNAPVRPNNNTNNYNKYNKHMKRRK